MAKRKNSDPLNRWVALIFALVAIFLGTLFTSQLIFDKPISREEATEVIGTFIDFESQQKLKGGFSVNCPRLYGQHKKGLYGS